MFRRSFKEKCPLSGTKTWVQYVNPGTFLLRWYRYVLLCFYYIASGSIATFLNSNIRGPSLKVNALSCWNYALHLTQPQTYLIELTNAKLVYNAFVDATVLFKLPYLHIWSVLSNRSYMGFEPELLNSQVHLRTLWATIQTYRLWKPIDMKLDMCDANVQKHQFPNLPAY